MDKAASIAPRGVSTAPGREETPHSAPGAAGFQDRTHTQSPLPDFVLTGEGDRIDRFTRLSRAFQVMGTLVAVVWPGEVTARRDADAVSWVGAILSLQEEHDQLTVVWRDEDHLDKFRPVADLAWAGLSESGWPVVHRNGDPHGLSPGLEEVSW